MREQHIVPIHDHGEIDGQLFIDMRFVDGVDLARLQGYPTAGALARAALAAGGRPAASPPSPRTIVGRGGAVGAPTLPPTGGPRGAVGLVAGIVTATVTSRGNEPTPSASTSAGTPARVDAASPAGTGKAVYSGVTPAFAGAETGSYSALGTNIADGARTAVSQHNAANPACNVGLTTFDTAGDPDKAPAAVTRSRRRAGRPRRRRASLRRRVDDRRRDLRGGGAGAHHPVGRQPVPDPQRPEDVLPRAQ